MNRCGFLVVVLSISLTAEHAEYAKSISLHRTFPRISRIPQCFPFGLVGLGPLRISGLLSHHLVSKLMLDGSAESPAALRKLR